MSDHDSKACTACLVAKPLTEFYDDKRFQDGKCYWCKQCTLAYRRRRREARLPGSKQCSDCAIDKPLADFRKNSRHPSGRNPCCKQCEASPGRLAKECMKCGQSKPMDDFIKIKICRNGRADTCKECRMLYHKQYRKTATGRQSSKKQLRKGQLKRKYGLSLEQYDSMLLKQGSKCGICGSPEPGRNRKVFFVDHDHGTGAVRGLLCHLCNNGLGNFRDDPDRLRGAIKYLRDRKVGIYGRTSSIGATRQVIRDVAI
jgi:Recombination endonuclease VII